MKKGVLSLLLITPLLFSCNNNTSTCDEMFCDETSQSSGGSFLDLEKDENPNYVYDTTVGNDGGVNYEIFVRSFYDTNNDGIGDLNGVKAKLPYLSELGVSNLWLMPIHKSPTYHGYDVTDYYSIHEDYGSLDDFKALVTEAKKYNIGIILDLVINHSSTQCQWFKDSYQDYSSGGSGKANWYNWQTESKSGYHRYGNSNFYYEGQFGNTMPDLNLENEEVKAELENVMKFWLDIGVAGFRLDAVKYYIGAGESHRSNIPVLKWINDFCKGVNPDCYIVGEAWSGFDTIKQYYESGVDSFFNFASSRESGTNGSILNAAKSVTKAPTFSSTIADMEKAIKEINPNAVNSYFLSNHDMDRVSNSLSGLNAKMAASITYLLPGTPYIYYGEEIGLKGVRNTSPDDQSDAKRRLPMIWSKTDKEGECEFPEQNRQDLNNVTQVSEGVYNQLNTDYSLLNHYKKVLNIRNKYNVFKHGTYEDMTSLVSEQNKFVMIYKITDGDKSLAVVHNLGVSRAEVEVGDTFKGILDSINTDKYKPMLKDGRLAISKHSTVLLELN